MLQKLTHEGFLIDGGIIQWPDEDGAIRRLDNYGNTEEVRRDGEPDYDEWRTLFYPHKDQTEQLQAYIDNNGNQCFFCTSLDIERVEEKIQDDTTYVVYHCHTCQRDWTVKLNTVKDIIKDVIMV